MSETTQLPWRRTSSPHFPGLPAWSRSTRDGATDLFEVSRLPVITTDWAWADADGSGVRVCILDSGVESGHPKVGELDRAVAIGAGDSGELAIADGEPIDPVGHGTACASVIKSIAPATSLSSVRVLTDGMFGTGAALLAGIEWAIEEGFDVINLSLATTKAQYVPALRELADRAYFRRSVLIASAHNMPVRSYPWTFSSVISVACHDEPDAMTFNYNPAPPVEFFARGVRVPVAWRNGSERRATGNSFAAPHIAGVCALILSKHRWLTPFQLKTVLYLTAHNVRAARDRANHSVIGGTS